MNPQSSTISSFFGSREMEALFADASMMQAWLDVEAALARTQAALGIIPEAAAREITAAASIDRLDASDIRAMSQRTGHPLVPLIRALTAAAGTAGRYVHLGATTQDVMDTGYVLRCRDGSAAIEQRLERLSDVIAALTIRYRDTVMAGRTHGQQALPTTFGLRLAGWLDEIRRHAERIDQMKRRLYVGSLGGAVGTMAGYGPLAFQVRDGVMAELGLAAAATSWHASPDRFAECVFVLAMIGATAEKLAREIYFLGRTEIAEVAEAQAPGQIGSSTMPHKRNPIRSEALIAAAMTLRSQVPLAMAAMVAQDDRDMGAGIVLWKLVPDAFALADGVLLRLVEVLDGLHVDPGAMAANVARTAGLVSSEAVMLRLADAIGREAAHGLVSEAARRSVEQAQPFREALLASSVVSDALRVDELDCLLDPRRYLGTATATIDAVLRTHGY